MGMQVPVYSPQTTQTPLPSSRQQVQTSPEMLGGGAAQGDLAMAQALGVASDQIGQVVQRQQEITNKTDVLNAYNSTVSQFDGITNKMLQLRGEEARNATDTAGGQYQEIMKSTVNGLANNAQKLAFSQMVDPMMRQNMMYVARHSAQQMDLALQNAGMGTMAIQADNIAKNITDPAAVSAGLETMRAAAKTTFGPYGADYAQAKVNESATTALSNGIGSLIDGNNVAAAQKALDTYGSIMHPLAAAQLQQKIKSKQTQIDVYGDISSFAANPANHVDGDVRKPFLPTAMETFAAQKATGPVGGSFEDFYKSMVTQEGTSAEKNSVGAVGFLQMKDGTYQMALQAAGLPQNTPRSPENEEIAGRSLLKQLYDKYGPKGAAVAWYAGPQNAPRVLAGLNPIGDNGQEYSADAKQDDGTGAINAPSVNEYVQQVFSRMGTSGTQPVIDMDKRQEYLRQLNQQNEVLARAWEQNVKTKVNSFDTFLYQNLDNPAIGPDQLRGQIASLGLVGHDAEALYRQGATALGFAGMRNFDPQAENDARWEMEQKIRSGEIANIQQAKMAYGDKVRPSMFKQYEALFANDASKVNAGNENYGFKGESLEAIGLGIKDAGINTEDPAYFSIKNGVMAKISSTIAHDGAISPDQIRAIAKEQSSEIAVKDAIGNKLHTYNVPYGYNITKYGVLAPDGTQVKWVNGQWVPDIK